jgi:hypothetical protein
MSVVALFTGISKLTSSADLPQASLKNTHFGDN